MKLLDLKLDRIRSGTYRPADFIIADAKDGDMGFGRTAPGPDRRQGGRLKTKVDYLAAMEAMVASGLVDIMLTSVSSADHLVSRGVFADSAVTPAVRLNDSTDIWTMRSGRYRDFPSRPFRTARLAAAVRVADLGLYSVTFSNDIERDLASLTDYAAFRAEAADRGMRYFLEVFNPAIDIGIPADQLPSFVNDCIVRSLAGVIGAEQPLFLKMPYNGPAALEELAGYHPEKLIIGILGGSKGTTRDTFELVSQAERHGARIALFGRKINLADSPLELVKLMRRVVERDIGPEEAVRAYHGALHETGITPTLDLAEDVQITEAVLQGG